MSDEPSLALLVDRFRVAAARNRAARPGYRSEDIAARNDALGALYRNSWKAVGDALVEEGRILDQEASLREQLSSVRETIRTALAEEAKVR